MEIGYLSSASFNIALIVQWLYCPECLEIKHVSPQAVGYAFCRSYTFGSVIFAVSHFVGDDDVDFTDFGLCGTDTPD